MNLMNVPADTPYALALGALPLLFTKEELATSLMHCSKRSERMGLDPEKIELLMSK